MNILVVAPYAINTPHFETELEIIQNHLDSGDNVTLLGCNGSLPVCDVNPKHEIAICLSCIGKRYHGIGLLSHKIDIKSLSQLDNNYQQEIKNLKIDFTSLEDLKGYQIDNFDIGWGVLSSLVSLQRDPVPDLKRNAGLIKHYIISAFTVYRSMQNYLSTNKVDRVYVFNGRYAPMRAVLRACQSKGVECYTHERASTLRKYSLCKNTSIHNIKYVESLIRESWFSSLPDEREQLATKFFTDKAKGISQSWFSFTKDQKESLLPSDWNYHKINVVIFISSEDEFVAVGDEWKNHIYKDQIDGITRILQSICSDNSIHFYIRIHPNLINVVNQQTNHLNTLAASNLTVIPGDSPISTYALMSKATKVLTFGSTAGIEAAYWGIPSILAGRSYYQNLGSTYNPINHEEVIELIKADLSSNNREGALMYGHYFGTFGIPFKHFESEGVFEGKFKGTQLQPIPSIRFLRRIIGFANRKTSGMLNRFWITDY